MYSGIVNAMSFQSFIAQMQARDEKSQEGGGGGAARPHPDLDSRVSHAARLALSSGKSMNEDALDYTQSNPHVRRGRDFAKALYDKYVTDGKEEEFLDQESSTLFKDGIIVTLMNQHGYKEPEIGHYRINDLEEMPFIQLQKSFCETIEQLQEQLEAKYQEEWKEKGKEFALKFIEENSEDELIRTPVAIHSDQIEEIYQESFEEGIQTVIGDIHFKKGKLAAEEFYNEFSKGKLKQNIIDLKLEGCVSAFFKTRDIENEYKKSYSDIHEDIGIRFYKDSFISGAGVFFQEKLKTLEEESKELASKTVDQLLEELGLDEARTTTKTRRGKRGKRGRGGGAAKSQAALVPAPASAPKPAPAPAPAPQVEAAPAKGPLPQTKEQKAAIQREKVAKQKIEDFKKQINTLKLTKDFQLIAPLKAKITAQEITVQKSEGDFKTVNERILQEYKNAFNDVEKYLYGNELTLNCDLRATMMKLCLQDNKKQKIMFQDKYNEIQVQTLVVCLLYLIKEGKLNEGRPADVLAEVQKSLSEHRTEDLYLEETKTIADGLNNKTLTVEKVLADAGFPFWV
jgi:hypothetical protein